MHSEVDLDCRLLRVVQAQMLISSKAHVQNWVMNFHASGAFQLVV